MGTALETGIDATPIPEVILGDVLNAIAVIRQEIEAGGGRAIEWVSPIALVHLPCRSWRAGLDPKAVDRVLGNSEWVPWIESDPHEAKIAELAGWLAINRAATVISTKTPRVVSRWIRSHEIRSPYRVLCPVGGPADPDLAAALPMWLESGRDSETLTYREARHRPPKVVRFNLGDIHGSITVGLIPLHAESVSPSIVGKILTAVGNEGISTTAGDGEVLRVGWSLLVGLGFHGIDPARITEAEKEALWRRTEEAATAAAAGDLAGVTRRGGSIASVPTTTIRQRQALLAETSIDRATKALLDAWKGHEFPTHGSMMRPWSEIVAAEITRVKTDEGDLAFQSVPGVRRPLLHRVSRKVGGDVVTEVELTTDALRALRIREGARGFRDRFTTKAGEMEYLVRVLPSPDGTPIEIRLCWDKGATALSPAALGETKALLDRSEKEDAEALIKSPSEVQERRRLLRARIAAVEDARVLFELVVKMWGLDRSRRVVPIARWEAAALLDIADDDADGLHRIHNALSAMRGIEFRSINYDEAGNTRGRGEGSVVAGFWWSARGDIDHRGRGNPGADPDTTIAVELTELGMGMVRAFYTGNTRPDSPKRHYLKTNTLSPWTRKAAGWSVAQERLAEFIRSNITSNADAAGRGREPVVVPNDRSPRLYGRDFCPLLPEGEWAGALGRFVVNPEAGWRLDSKGGRGLLAMMGRPVPRTAGAARMATVVAEAFADLRAVLEVMGGEAFGREGRRWLTTEEVASLPGRRPLETPLYLFVPPDYARREAKVVEDHHRARVDRGETTTLVTVTEDPDAYRAQLRPTEMGESETLRAEVRALRRSRKVSQDALAKVIGIQQRHLSRWEAGTANLSAEAMGLLREWIRGGIKAPPAGGV